jgi:hypothetical protein
MFVSGPYNGANVVRRQIDTGRLSNRGKRIVIALIAIGLLTFFFPIVVSEPIHSPEPSSFLDVALGGHGQHPVGSLFVNIVYIPFELVYGLLLACLGVVLFLPRRNVLRWLSLAGIFLLISPFFGMTGAVKLAAMMESGRATLWGILGFVMLGLAGVTWTDATTS